MPRTLNRLSDRKVRTAKPGMLCDGGGLYLQVTTGPGGNIRKSWLFRFAASGSERQMGLGSLDTVSVAGAREKARECRRLLQDAIDPIAHRNARRAAQRLADTKAMTFDECRDAYVAAHRAGWQSTKHAADWTKTLAVDISPVFGSLPVQAVDVGLVIKALGPIWAKKTETASRVRGRIEAVLNWATVRGFREGENPARWRGHLDKLLPRRSKVQAIEHHAALPYDGIGEFMAALRGRQGIAARALEFGILTAARTGEVLGARWDEIDLAAKVWTIPAARMKGKREHRVPLSNAAVAVLKRTEAVRKNDQVFPGNRRAVLSDRALRDVLSRMGRRDVTPHGFRSTFRDWAAERTNFPSEVVEMALAHAVGNKVEEAYRRGDLFEKRRKLMDAWAAHCARPVRTEPKVVAPRGKAEIPAVAG